MAKAKTWEEYKAECEAVAKPGITLVGWVGEWKGAHTKLHCRCELHGDWTSTVIINFKNGRSCRECGIDVSRCTASNPRSAATKSWDYYKTTCEDIAKDGITILGYIEPWKGQKTILKCHCSIHGVWETTSITTFKQGTSCPECGKLSTIAAHKRATTDFSKVFLSTGSFMEGTKFWRSDRVDSRGRFAYWCYSCPICSTDEYVRAGLCSGVFEAAMNTLKNGSLSCRCSKRFLYTKEQWEFRLATKCAERGYTFCGWVKPHLTKINSSKDYFYYNCPLHGKHKMIPTCLLIGQGCPVCAGNNQTQCYINIVTDYDIPVALKVGIANDAHVRLKSQNRRNLFQMQQLAVYAFSTVEDCKAAERACLSELRCSVLSARELKDGWTETVALTDYDKVVSIYERFGGVRVDTLTEEE